MLASLRRIRGNDVVWVFGSAGFGRSYGLFYLAAARLLGRKPSLRFFGGRPYQKIAAMKPFPQKFFIRAFSLAHRIVVQTEVGKSEFPSELHHLIGVIPGYRLIDQGQLDQVVDASGSVKFYYAGLLSRDKGSFVLLDAFAIAQGNLAALGIRSELHAFGAETDGWAEYAQGRSGVHYHGAVTNEDLVAEIGAFDALVFPSMIDREGHPGTIVEALFAGKPTICFDLPGPTEIISDNRNGLVIEQMEADSLAAAMTRLGQTTSLRVRLGSQASADSRRFDARRAVPDLIDAMGT
jgi:glycosyltransferase involved in cell wall biosynthesis